MLNRQQRGEAARLTADRRRREDEAPRLALEVPGLASLRLDIKEAKPGSVIATAAHIRRIVVESAPALFVVRCGDADCKDGGVHDFTREVMWSLRQSLTQFDGNVSCDGCPCVLRFVATAVYAKPSEIAATLAARLAAEALPAPSPGPPAQHVDGPPRRPGRAVDSSQ